MATNVVFEEGDQFSANVSGVTGSGGSGVILSGDPGVLGQLPFVALTDEDADGIATIKTNGVADLFVDAEAAAVNPGDLLYFDAADSNKINNSSSGNVRFGYALGSVGNGATGTIRVKIGY
jgi:predicted RecA/RadA family phage recombinase